MKNTSKQRPYQPPNLRAIRADVQEHLLEFARGVLFAFDDRKDEMSKEEYRLRVRCAYMEMQRLGKFYGYDASCFPVPALKDIPW